MTKRIVVATSNAGKVRELQRTLPTADGFRLIPQGEFGIASVAETACTFVENALAKARHAARESGLPALADDSGLVVPALGGAPGVHSARYAGEPADDARNNAKLLHALAEIEDRRAFFVCTLTYLHAPDDPAPAIATGRWAGAIVDTPRGRNGFGYDPLFLIPTLGRTAAELPLAEKNRLSHRGLASRRLLELIAEES